MAIVNKEGEIQHHTDDLEPVYYCTHCLSLDIRELDDEADYCNRCGNTDVAKATIYKWEEMYKKMYGHTLLDK